mmetsp:Transcript_109019/g.188775  ORF Transcript_109019/g.188775 Transcript_109019/m.188775 type:complete len:208 (-) Transcript_109019:711-1334(-)
MASSMRPIGSLRARATRASCSCSTWASTSSRARQVATAWPAPKNRATSTEARKVRPTMYAANGRCHRDRSVAVDHCCWNSSFSSSFSSSSPSRETRWRNHLHLETSLGSGANLLWFNLLWLGWTVMLRSKARDTFKSVLRVMFRSVLAETLRSRGWASPSVVLMEAVRSGLRDRFRDEAFGSAAAEGPVSKPRRGCRTNRTPRIKVG